MHKTARAIAAGLLVVLAGGALLWRHFSSNSSAPVVTARKAHEAMITAPMEPEPPRVTSVPNPEKGLWARPAPAVAARHIRRCSIGAALSPMGASASVLERLSDGDIAGVFSQLKAQAQAGDTSAANQLDYIAHRTCEIARNSQATELVESNSLPSADRNWFQAALDASNAFKQQLQNDCQQSLDKSAIDTWVTQAAARGDPASEYSLWMFGGTNIRRHIDAHLRAAALGGYPWAQLSYVGVSNQDAPGVIYGGEPSDHPEDLLRVAAQTIPAAKEQLARCEFSGCKYVAQDIPAAIADAGSAAQQGSVGAILDIGPQLPASQIDPNQVQAWRLINAALQLQGYVGANLSVERIKSASAVLNSPTITPQVRALADELWQRYGAKILTGLGCTQ